MLHNVVMKKSEPYEILCDLELSYKGKIRVRLDTTLKINVTFKEYMIPVSVTVELNSLFAIMRLCFVPMRHGMSWISFIGEPIADVVVQPVINDVDWLQDYPAAVALLEKGLAMLFRKLIFPNRIDLDVPLSC
jgi:hypothetical protein